MTAPVEDGPSDSATGTPRQRGSGAPDDGEQVSLSCQARDEVSIDAILGGRVEIIQQVRGGVRCGHDAVLLAATIADRTQGHIVDLGAGTGAVGFMAAARASGVTVSCVECDRTSLGLAARALERPLNQAFRDRVELVEGDVRDLPSTWQPGVAKAHAVLINPPYFRAGEGRRSPDRRRQKARGLDRDGLAPWLLAARRLLMPGGLLGLVLPPYLLSDALHPAFGDTQLFPVMSREGRPAVRLIITSRLGRRGGLKIMPPLILHRNDEQALAPISQALFDGVIDLERAVAG
ncbi:MAG: methyltransferase [Pseudomonadota bacterium]